MQACLLYAITLISSIMIASDGPPSQGVVGRVTFQEQWLAPRVGLEEPGFTFPSTVDIASLPEVNFDDSRSLLRYVLASTPQRLRVIPTERYYYWHFAYGSRVIHGNIRFTEIEQGIVNIGYFDPLDRDLRDGASFGTDEGMRVTNIADDTYQIEFEGIAREVQLMRFLGHNHHSDLLEGEQPVASVRDESGLGFDLIFYEPESYFYFVLCPESYQTEEIVRVLPAQPFEIGVESRFVYFHDPASGRRILVGVSDSNIWLNNYFDGPFDQVPPNLQLRDKLEAAYPYVTLRGGIDEHGNFNALDHQRVAISPYQAYSGPADQLVEKLATRYEPALACPQVWLPFVFESKRLFHLRILTPDPVPSGIGNHETVLSRQWPPGHLVLESRADKPAPFDRTSDPDDAHP